MYIPDMLTKHRLSAFSDVGELIQEEILCTSIVNGYSMSYNVNVNEYMLI
jgi:hypothetical protein